MAGWLSLVSSFQVPPLGLYPKWLRYAEAGTLETTDRNLLGIPPKLEGSFRGVSFEPNGFQRGIRLEATGEIANVRSLQMS